MLKEQRILPKKFERFVITTVCSPLFIRRKEKKDVHHFYRLCFADVKEEEKEKKRLHVFGAVAFCCMYAN
jgi:hypothetical protein